LLRRGRQGIALGAGQDKTFYLEPYGGSALLAGQSGIGKSTLATALTEQMADNQFEFCVFDPEGDYDELENAVTVGDIESPPSPEEVVRLLRQASTNLVVNTQHLTARERPQFFLELLPQVSALRQSTGRPHWLLIDEAHHLLPAGRPAAQLISEELPAAVFITVHPEAMSPDALRSVDVLVAIGLDAARVVTAFCDAIKVDVPQIERVPHDDEVLVWRRSSGEPPRYIEAIQPKQVHKRHTRKYAEGHLGKDLSFYFRGPEGALNLRARNLVQFLELADGVDDRTWMHHLQRGDYSAWFSRVIKNDELAEAAAQIESDAHVDAQESRRRIRAAVVQRYTAPVRIEDRGNS
jgi:hypothetical protein